MLIVGDVGGEVLIVPEVFSWMTVTVAIGTISKLFSGYLIVLNLYFQDLITSLLVLSHMTLVVLNIKLHIQVEVVPTPN